MKNKNYKFKGMDRIAKILIHCGLSYLWLHQKEIVHLNVTLIHSILYETTLQETKAMSSQSNKGQNYITLKEECKRETYLYTLSKKRAINFLKFRTANHRLLVETGRYTNIDYQDRIRPLCHKDVGDMFHYLLSCPNFKTERKRYLLPSDYRKPSMLTYIKIMTTKNQNLLNHISDFTSLIMKKFRA